MIDDDEANAALLRRKLSKAFPAAAIFMGSSKGAASVCQSRIADLFVVAYTLGGRTAPELLSTIRRKEGLLPVLVVSGTASYRDQCLAAGATFFATYDENFAEVVGAGRPLGTPDFDERCQGAA